MPSRTIRDARRALEEDVRPFVTDYQASQHAQRLAQAEAGARERAEAFIQEREAEVWDARDRILRELTHVRDQLHDLASEGSLGRVSATTYAQRMEQLLAAQEAAEERLAQTEEAIARIAAVEDDPIAWADDLAERFPRLKEDFPW